MCKGPEAKGSQAGGTDEMTGRRQFGESSGDISNDVRRG